jgi:Domain of unknown function (DUF2382)
MSMKLDASIVNTGTRFRIFPQPCFLKVFSEPETIWIKTPPHTIQPGPADDRMFVVDAINKVPYSAFYHPPYRGDKNSPVKPGPDGHFDHLSPGTPAFSAAAMYAIVHLVLDIWEDYFDHQIEWYFEPDFARLELIPFLEWDNAQAGYGFMEFGYNRLPGGGIDHSRPYCEHFDMLAHELGHSLIFSTVGIPLNPADEAIDYGGMHESAGDLVAIIAALHFDSVVDHLLQHTMGNLFTVNELTRVGELSDSREIRVAFNDARMSAVGNELHDRSLPLTGGIFDIMVEIYQKKLVQQRFITQDLVSRATQGIGRYQDLKIIQAEFEEAYKGNESGFKEALLEARDYLGQLLACTWDQLSPDFLTYHDILRGLLRSDRTWGGEHQQTIRECFAWREISPLPGSILLRPRILRGCGLGVDRFAIVRPPSGTGAGGGNPRDPGNSDISGRTPWMMDTREEAVISKMGRVIEEVVIGKEVAEKIETIRETLRRTDVQIEEVPGVRAFDEYAGDFRSYYNQHLAGSGLAYERYSPAFRYGHSLASNEPFHSQSWATIEPDARRLWEEKNSGSWDQIKDAIRFSWETVRDHTRERIPIEPDKASTLYLNIWFPDRPQEKVCLTVGREERLLVNLGPSRGIDHLGTSNPLSREAVSSVYATDHIDVLVLCPGANVLPLRNRLSVPPRPNDVAAFKITPMRPGPFDLMVVLLVRNEPIHRTTFSFEAIGAEDPGNAVNDLKTTGSHR